jgi:hypothetical protein
MERLASIIQVLPVPDHIPYTLNIGCGEFSESNLFQQMWSGWLHIGIDLDHDALRQSPPTIARIQSNAKQLPFPLGFRFGFILIRHPDIARSGESWSVIFHTIPAYLAQGGILLLTFYTLDEYDFAAHRINLERMSIKPQLLAPLGLVGRDKHILAYRG